MNFKNVTFETSETFGIINVLTRFILFYHSPSDERTFKVLMIYFEIR